MNQSSELDRFARKIFPQPRFLNSPNIQQWCSFKSSVKQVSPKPAFHLYLGPSLALLASEVLEFLTHNLSTVALSLKPTLFASKMPSSGASLVAQWLRICLPMQGTRVQALVWEDPTCHGAIRPVSHNY